MQVGRAPRVPIINIVDASIRTNRPCRGKINFVPSLLGMNWIELPDIKSTIHDPSILPVSSERKLALKNVVRDRREQCPRTSLSIWRAVCQTVNAMRCKSVSVSSCSGVSSFRLLFTVSWRVSPQRQQFARSQARDSELLFEFVMVL